MRIPALPTIIVPLLTLPGDVAHGQWLQFGGPGRDFHCPSGDLAAAWPEFGPPLIWQREIGEGYSGILVDGEQLFTMDRRDGKEFALCLDRATGRTIWEHGYAVSISEGARQFGGGPAATPALAGDRMVTIGRSMHLHCFDKNTGEVLWSRNLLEEFGLPLAGRGFSASPLLFEDMILLPLGGSAKIQAEDDSSGWDNEGAAIAAFELETGMLVWARHDFPPSKASPILIDFEGELQLVAFMGNELVGLDPFDGELLWRHQHPTSYGFNCATPLYDGVDTLFCSSNYNNGTDAVQLVAGENGIEARKKWSSMRLRVHFTNLLLLGDRLYGISGMSSPGFLTCLDANTGELRWRARGFPKANLLAAGERMLLLDENGFLSLASFDGEAVEIQSQIEITGSRSYCAPTLVDTQLHVRDNDVLRVLDLSTEGVARHATGTANRIRPLQPELPPEAEDWFGIYQDSADDSQQLRIESNAGWLQVEWNGEEVFRLVPRDGSSHWEFLEDRNSGSEDRSIEWRTDSEGHLAGFTLHHWHSHPNARSRHFRRVPGS